MALTENQRVARLLRQPTPGPDAQDAIEAVLLQETGASDDILLTEDGDTIVLDE